MLGLVVAHVQRHIVALLDLDGARAYRHARDCFPNFAILGCGARLATVYCVRGALVLAIYAQVDGDTTVMKVALCNTLDTVNV